MTAHEALWIIKVQLSKTEQNLQAVKVLEDTVKSVDRLHIDDEPNYTLGHLFGNVKHDLSNLTLGDFGTEAEHMKNHMEKVGTKDIQDLKQNMCARYDWAEDDEIVVYYDLCDTEGKDGNK